MKLRKMRLARGWAQREVATKMGWKSVNSYAIDGIGTTTASDAPHVKTAGGGSDFSVQSPNF